MDKELFQLLAETAVKLQSESEPLIKSRQLSKSPTVRAYANVINQGDDAFADILYKYLNGDVEVDEAVRKLNSREGALIKAGNFYKRLEGHHPIYQKLLANRLFRADPRKALEVIKIIKDQLPSNLSPGTDPDKLIYTTRPLHGIIGHGGNFQANTAVSIDTEVTPKQMVDQLYPDLVDAVYRAGYLEANPAHRLMVSKAGEALGMTDPDKQPLKIKQSLAKQSKQFPILPTELEGVAEATARVVPPDPGNALRAGLKGLGDVYELAKYRGAQNIGAITPELAIGAGGSLLAGAGAIQSYAENRRQGLSRPQAAFDTAGMLLGAEAGGRLGLSASQLVPHPVVKIAAPIAGAVIGGVVGEKGVEAIREKANPASRTKNVNTVLPNLIPTPKPVMANTPTGVAQLKAMPKSKNIDLVNEAKYFIVNPIRSAFDRVFGNRPI